MDKAKPRNPVPIAKAGIIEGALALRRIGHIADKEFHMAKFDWKKHAKNHDCHETTTLKIKGRSVQCEGAPEADDVASCADLLAKQEPTRKVLEALVALVAIEPPTDSVLHGLSLIVAQMAPTNELLKSLADAVVEENPHIYDLVDGQRATKSTLNILTNLVAQTTPNKRIVETLTELLAQQSPSQELLKAMANVLHSPRAHKETRLS
jgi:hypothetical protein